MGPWQERMGMSLPGLPANRGLAARFASPTTDWITPMSTYLVAARCRSARPPLKHGPSPRGPTRIRAAPLILSPTMAGYSSWMAALLSSSGAVGDEEMYTWDRTTSAWHFGWG